MKFYPERFSLPVLPRHIFAVAAFALCSEQALAVEPFTVKDIRVEGIQRTEPGTVFNYLPVHVGDTYTDDKGIAAIKALYATGMFKDVRIETQGDILIVSIEERPAIASVDFSGVKEFEKDKLVTSLKEIGVGEGRIFDKSQVDRAEQELKRQYLSHGLYGVVVTTTVTPIERNRVAITFAVDEGDVARIKQIKFVGNKAFSDKELLGNIALSTPGWFTWYTKADQYSKQKLTGDIDSLKSYYLNHGYLEMRVDSTQVSISPDKKDIYITVNLTEGEKFTVSDIKLEGQMLGREDEFKELLQLRKGDVYSGEKLTDSIKKITDRMGNFGYAFANVNANPQIDQEKKEVAFTILVDPGKRVYVHHINFSGNAKTRDEVIRRELRQYEESWYDGEKIKRSRDRVDQLGYFKDVTLETPEVPGSTDQVDINMNVTEKQFGSVSFGVGYSQAEKFSLTAGFQQENAFGSGDTVGVQVNTSKINETLVVSYTQPYFTDDGVSRTDEVYLRTNRPPLVNTGEYKVRTVGFKESFGVPFTDTDRVFFGIGIEREVVETYFNIPGYNNSPTNYIDFVNDFGNGSAATTDSVPMTAAWQREGRDSALTPSSGRLQRANFEVSTLGSLRYYRAIYHDEYYYPISRTTTLAVSGEADYGHGLDGEPYPVFKNFQAGGVGSVRGFAPSSLGPQDSQGNPLGGASRLLASAELQIPFPGAGNDRSLRWLVFGDAGNVFAQGVTPNLAQLRSSVGFGVSWISPIGPLKISYGIPLRTEPGDRIDRFQFQFGTGF